MKVNHRKRLIIFLLFAFCISCVTYAEPGKIIYLIPENFTGGVIILYNQSDGITPETDRDGTIIFRVPAEGLIKVKLPLDKAVYRMEYYFVDGQGNRTPIEYLYPAHYVKNPGDTTSRNIDEVSAEEAKNKIFATQHRTANFNISGEKVYIESFLIEKPSLALQTFLRTEDKISEIQRNLLKAGNPSVK